VEGGDKMSERRLRINIHFIDGEDYKSFTSGEYDKKDLEALLDWFESGRKAVFQLDYKNSWSYYFQRSSIKYIEVRYI